MGYPDAAVIQPGMSTRRASSLSGPAESQELVRRLIGMAVPAVTLHNTEGERIVLGGGISFVVAHGVIMNVFYPVTAPGLNAAEVAAQLRNGR